MTHWVSIDENKIVGRAGDYYMTCELFASGFRWKVFLNGKLVKAGIESSLEKAKQKAEGTQS